MIGIPSLSKAPLQATTFNPDRLALAESDRFIERIDKKHLSIPAIPGLAKPWCAQIEIRTNFLEKQSPHQRRHRGLLLEMAGGPEQRSHGGARLGGRRGRWFVREKSLGGDRRG